MNRCRRYTKRSWCPRIELQSASRSETPAIPWFWSPASPSGASIGKDPGSPSGSTKVLTTSRCRQSPSSWRRKFLRLCSDTSSAAPSGLAGLVGLRIRGSRGAALRHDDVHPGVPELIDGGRLEPVVGDDELQRLRAAHGEQRVALEL